MSNNGISESRFCMWRAVVAMVHADGVVTPHELSFINSHIRNIELSPDQLKTIGEDLQCAKDPYVVFSSISEKKDKYDFFALARALSWCDGDFASQEDKILKHLQSVLDNEQDRALLDDSRELMNEVELCDNQWRFKSERSKSLFGFLNKRAA